VRAYRTEGIIIKRRNTGEADRVLTILTRDYGKINVKAVGVRKITSRRSAHVELLNYAQLGLYKGNGSPVLTEAKMIEDFSKIKDNLQKVGYAYHLCELVNGLCPENQENRSVFDLLKHTLSLLTRETNQSSPALTDKNRFMVRESAFVDAHDDTRAVIHDFEIKLLTILGYWDNREQFATLDTQAYIENIIERKLKSRNIFSKLQ